MASARSFLPGSSTKKCKECRLMLSLTSFHRDKHRKDGHYSVCISCANMKRNARNRKRKAMMRQAMEQFD